MKFLFGLLDLCAGQRDVLLLSRGVQEVLGAVATCSWVRGGGKEEREEEEEEREERGEVEGRKKSISKQLAVSTMEFSDDLRVLDFVYVVDESGKRESADFAELAKIKNAELTIIKNAELAKMC